MHMNPPQRSTATVILAITALCACTAPVGGEAPESWLAGDGKSDDRSARGFSDEATLLDRFNEEIIPAYQQGDRGEFEGARGTRISWVAYPDPDETAALVILNGRTESHAEYAELIHDLRDRGFSLYLMDHRGQGFSERLLDDPERGYVDDFNRYATDVHTFIRDVVGTWPGRRVVGLGHSMGGAVLARYAIDHPDALDAIVLSSPMMQIDFGETAESTVYALAYGLWNSWYANGQGPYDPNRPFEDNDHTHSLPRWQMQRRVNEHLYPEARLGGTTWGWLVQAMDATEILRDDASGLATPALLLSAGEDEVVRRDAQRDFCEAAARCELVELSGARHELLMETDDIRDQVLTHALTFLSAEHD